MTERDPYPSEKQDRFIVRLPDGMRDRIKAAAEAANRSMNAEIVATLEEKYPAVELSYRNLLAMTLDFLIDEGFTSKTKAEKEEVLAKLDSLPVEIREKTADKLTNEILDGLDAQVAEYRRSNSLP